MAKAIVSNWVGLYLTVGLLGDEVMNVTLSYVVADLNVNESHSVQFQVSITDTEATVKANAAAAIVADAAVAGYSLNVTDVLFPDGTKGV